MQWGLVARRILWVSAWVSSFLTCVNCLLSVAYVWTAGDLPSRELGWVLASIAASALLTGINLLATGHGD